MKLKYAIQLAIIGVILKLISVLLHIIANWIIYDYGMVQLFKQLNSVASFISLLGILLLLAFFIILYKNQK